MIDQTAKQSKFADVEKYKDILQAFLDSFAHPVWIVDANGGILMNELAKALQKQGFPIDTAVAKSSPNGARSFQLKGRNYRVQQQEMNHGTNAFLYELFDETPAVAKLRESTIRLRMALAS
jgi:hypothetical protein